MVCSKTLLPAGAHLCTFSQAKPFSHRKYGEQVVLSLVVQGKGCGLGLHHFLRLEKLNSRDRDILCALIGENFDTRFANDSVSLALEIEALCAGAEFEVITGASPCGRFNKMKNIRRIL